MKGQPLAEVAPEGLLLHCLGLPGPQPLDMAEVVPVGGKGSMFGSLYKLEGCTTHARSWMARRWGSCRRRVEELRSKECDLRVLFAIKQ